MWITAAVIGQINTLHSLKWGLVQPRTMYILSRLVKDNGHLVPYREALTSQHTLTPLHSALWLCVCVHAFFYLLHLMFMLRDIHFACFFFFSAGINWSQKCLLSISSLSTLHVFIEYRMLVHGIRFILSALMYLFQITLPVSHNTHIRPNTLTYTL